MSKFRKKYFLHQRQKQLCLCLSLNNFLILFWRKTEKKILLGESLWQNVDSVKESTWSSKPHSREKNKKQKKTKKKKTPQISYSTKCYFSHIKKQKENVYSKLPQEIIHVILKS